MRERPTTASSSVADEDEPRRRREAVIMVAKIGAIIFSFEALIMVALSRYDVSAIPFSQDFLDAASLTLLASPVIYYGVARPFSTAARVAEARLRDHLVATEQLLAQNERLRISLQEANAATADTHERILQRIGADLHDSPAQLLTYVLLQLRRMEPIVDLARERNVKVDLAKLIHVTDRSMREVRAISTGLTLPELAGCSLEAAIELAIRRHMELTGSEVETTFVDLPKDVPQALKACIYRFVQEGLCNAHHHGGTASQKVFARGGQRLEIEVIDHGAGFDISHAKTSGIGLIGMRARIQSMGGTLTIDSSTGRGTTLTAAFAMGQENPS